jgi:hypothetical protein
MSNILREMYNELQSSPITSYRASNLSHDFLKIRDQYLPKLMEGKFLTKQSRYVHDIVVLISSHLLDDLQTIWDVSYNDYHSISPESANVNNEYIVL